MGTLRRSRLAFVALALAAFAPQPGAAAAVAPGTYADRLAEHGLAAGVALQEPGGAASVRGFGLADRRGGVAIDGDTAFPLASVAKPITAIAVLRLVQDGRLRLDQPLAAFFAAVPVAKRRITVRDLLLHASGLPDAMPGVHDDDVLSRSQAVRRILALPLAGPRGRYAYSDAGYSLLAAIVETAAGEPFTTYMRDRVFAPAGLTGSGFYGDARYANGNVAHAYVDGRDEGSAASGRPVTFALLGAGGVVSTASDLVRLIEALRAGRILDPAHLALLTRPVLIEDPAEPERRASLGFSTVRTAGGLLLEHDGAGVSDGETAYLGWRLDGLTAVVLANDAALPATAAGPLLVRALAGGEVPALPAVQPMPVASLGEFAGRYVGAGGAIGIRPSGGALVVTIDGQRAIDTLLGIPHELRPVLASISAEAVRAARARFGPARRLVDLGSRPGSLGGATTDIGVGGPGGVVRTRWFWDAGAEGPEIVRVDLDARPQPIVFRPIGGRRFAAFVPALGGLATLRALDGRLRLGDGSVFCRGSCRFR